ncbi:uncharacterized protein LOC132755468 [Ruditapes philippinarum]|uniref:uncharacterized protein LOC132755468 n=1 Tax=Ruditapes philippinarum TaxID=129788 RepID=UPI00295BABDF|nr:uncharacterized protein LOC132755468 [Ruditapes philippinarum]XP_060602318.1 uncharacterized protein LOC132755468 [Ruditapes philippinarum]XP_060602319.1 uncharacterized protein LOC132755468 [Ruditapes philippinarum]
MEGASRIMFSNKVMALMFLSAIFHSMGFATPGWLFMKLSNGTIHTGLWYGVHCDSSSCSTNTIWNLDQSHFKFKDSESLSSVLSKYQVIDTVALVASFVAILMNIVHRKTDQKLRFIWSVAICIIAMFMAGILGIVTAAHFSNRIRHAEEFYNTILENESPYRIPYSIIFTGLGGLVAIIAYIIVAYRIAMDRDKKQLSNISYQMYNLD